MHRVMRQSQFRASTGLESATNSENFALQVCFGLTGNADMLQIWVAPGGGSDMPDRSKRSICSTCYHKVSETVASCPSCGAAIKRGSWNRIGILALAGFLAFNAGMAVWFWNEDGSTAAAGSMNGSSLQGFWPEIATSQLIIYWMVGAMALGALAYFSRAK